MLLFLGMTISSTTGISLEEQSTILKFNNPPYIPSDPEPKNGSTGVDTGILSWTGGDPDPDDMVTYKLYFGNETNPPYIMLIGRNIAQLITGRLLQKIIMVQQLTVRSGVLPQ